MAAYNNYQQTEEQSMVPPYMACPICNNRLPEQLLTCGHRPMLCYTCQASCADTLRCDEDLICAVCMASKWQQMTAMGYQLNIPLLVKCPRCFNDLHGPELLSCGHIFCSICLTNGNINCSVCRETALSRDAPSWWETRKRKWTFTTCEDIFNRFTKKRRVDPGNDVAYSPDDYGHSASHSCTRGCDYPCELCYGDHSRASVSEKHNVIRARVTKKPRVISNATSRKQKVNEAIEDSMIGNVRPIASDPIQRDVTNIDNIQFMWYNRCEGEIKTEVVNEPVKRVKCTETAGVKRPDVKKVKVDEVVRIPCQCDSVLSMVGHKKHIYVIYDSPTGLTIHCYTSDGQLRHNYHEIRTDTNVQGISVMEKESQAMLVISNYSSRMLFWIRIGEDFSMRPHRTQKVDYKPSGLYNDGCALMVCDHINCKIHLYDCIGRSLHVITLPDDVMPQRVIRHSCDGQYVVTAWRNRPVVIIDEKGTILKSHSHNLEEPRDVIIDKSGRIVIVDVMSNQLMSLSKGDDDFKVFGPLQDLNSPTCIFFQADQHRLYVSGSDDNDICHVFICDYDYFY